jgi:hypothetical protein
VRFHISHVPWFSRKPWVSVLGFQENFRFQFQLNFDRGGIFVAVVSNALQIPKPWVPVLFKRIPYLVWLRNRTWFHQYSAHNPISELPGIEQRCSDQLKVATCQNTIICMVHFWKATNYVPRKWELVQWWSPVIFQSKFGFQHKAKGMVWTTKSRLEIGPDFRICQLELQVFYPKSHQELGRTSVGVLCYKHSSWVGLSQIWYKYKFGWVCY